MAGEEPKTSSSRSTTTPRRRTGSTPRIDFAARKGSWSYPGTAKSLTATSASRTRATGRPTDADWKLPENWQQIILDGLARAAREVPLAQALPGHLRALRRVRGQVPLLHRLRRPEEHAGPAGRAAALGLPQRLHRRGQAPRRARGRAGPDRRRPQGVVLLLLPVHRVPPLLGLLPVRDRHGGDHHASPASSSTSSACNINWVIEPVANCDRTGNHLGIQPHTLQGQRRVPGRRARGDDRGPRATRRINAKGAEILFVIPSADYFAEPGHLHVHGLPAPLPRDRSRLHLQHLRLRGRQLRALHLARHDQAPERQDLRRGQAPRGQVDPRRASAATCGASSTSTWTR